MSDYDRWFMGFALPFNVYCTDSTSAVPLYRLLRRWPFALEGASENTMRLLKVAVVYVVPKPNREM